MGQGLFFESDRAKLYGFYHPAASRPESMGVVFVHGCFEERQDAHLVVRDAAERLASRGFPSLRFDLSGHGDSAGEFDEASLTQWGQDTLRACDTLRSLAGCDTVALVGLRLGAILAARAAAAPEISDRVARLVLWQPVVDGNAYMMETLRAFLAAEMVVHKRVKTSREALVEKLRGGDSVNVSGYRVSPALFRDISSAKLADAIAEVRVPTLVVDVVRNANARGSAELDALRSARGDGLVLARVVESQPLYAEGRNFVNRADEVYRATVGFLEGSPP